VIEHARRNEVVVMTDPRASPTGYPFKVVEWANDAETRPRRERLCDLGYLRAAYRRPDGRIDYRCPSEPVEDYVRKGGTIAETEGRRCLCNALLANIGYAQPRANEAAEPPLLTSGDDLETISIFLAGRTRYTAGDVISYLLDEAVV
jgi:NAD(P)H-dependent flavin oxidoreductase YrpB (nitropropane dioxygenase family)